MFYQCWNCETIYNIVNRVATNVVLVNRCWFFISNIPNKMLVFAGYPMLELCLYIENYRLYNVGIVGIYRVSNVRIIIQFLY